MCGQALHLAGEGIDDELYVLGRHPLDSLLHNVVTVLVFDASQNVLLELFHQGRLLVGKDVLQGLGRSVIDDVKNEWKIKPFEQPCNRTFVTIKSRCDSSSDSPKSSFVTDYHVRRISGSHSCQRRPS